MMQLANIRILEMLCNAGPQLAAATPPALQYFMPAAMRTKQKVSLASALPRLAGYASARWHWHQLVVIITHTVTNTS
jgi:hypothetical protein